MQHAYISTAGRGYGQYREVRKLRSSPTGHNHSCMCSPGRLAADLSFFADRVDFLAKFLSSCSVRKANLVRKRKSCINVDAEYKTA